MENLAMIAPTGNPDVPALTVDLTSVVDMIVIYSKTSLIVFSLFFPCDYDHSCNIH
jgi:hypothetical protein